MTGCNVLARDGGTIALQLRPNCEYCDKELPADALTARISDLYSLLERVKKPDRF
jgi:uncharacterized protein DUF1272